MPNPPGGSNDKTARSLERILLANKLLPVTLSINNRSGGGGSIAYTYVQQRQGDPHDLAVADPAILTNHIVGSSPLRHTDLTAAKRFSGEFATVPTWNEQGVDFTFGAWRAMFAPKDLTAPQLAYWEGVLKKATEAPEWKEELEKNIWSNVFTPSAQFAKNLEQDYAAMKAVRVDLGLAK